MEEYTQLTLDDWLAMKESLKRDLIGVQESFVRIGYTLRKIEEQKALRDAFSSGRRHGNDPAGDAKGRYPGTETFQQGGAGTRSGGFTGKAGVEVLREQCGDCEAIGAERGLCRR